MPYKYHPPTFPNCTYCTFPAPLCLPFETIFIIIVPSILQCSLSFCQRILFICRVIEAVYRIVIVLKADVAKELVPPTSLLLLS